MGTASSVQRSQVTIGCQLCQGKNKIQWKCVNCQFLMCSGCKDNIHLRIAKDHKIINIKDIGELNPGESFNFSDIHCNEHSDHVCCSYCKICKKVVCVKCLMTVHNGHEFVDEEDFLSKKKFLWEGQKRAVKKLEELSKAETKLEKFKESEDAMYIKVKQDFQKNVATNQFSEILTELDVKMKSVYQIIDTEFKNLNREKGKFKEVINVVDLIKITKDFCQFFEKFDELITTLNCDRIPCNTYIESISDFNVEEHIVSKFGQIKTKDLEAKISFRVDKKYTTDIRIVGFLTMLSDRTLLISDSSLVQHVKIESSFQVISNFSIRILAMAVIPSGDILVSTGDSRLKLLNIKTGEMTLSVYNVHPNLQSRSIHVTDDHRVIIGARSHKNRRPVTRRSVVIVLDQKGDHLMEYEYDTDNKPLFANPCVLSNTLNGNIFVADKGAYEKTRRRVVVLGQGGDVIQVYSGNPKINTEKNPFNPTDIITMCSGNIIVIDSTKVNTLHILDYNGQLIALYNLLDIGIKHSYSLALSSRGHFFIGCSCRTGSPDTYKAKLYELEYFGI